MFIQTSFSIFSIFLNCFQFFQFFPIFFNSFLFFNFLNFFINFFQFFFNFINFFPIVFNCFLLICLLIETYQNWNHPKWITARQSRPLTAVICTVRAVPTAKVTTRAPRVNCAAARATLSTAIELRSRRTRSSTSKKTGPWASAFCRDGRRPTPGPRPTGPPNPRTDPLKSNAANLKVLSLTYRFNQLIFKRFNLQLLSNVTTYYIIEKINNLIILKRLVIKSD